MNNMKNIIVLGAGNGGISAILRLNTLFRKSYHYRIHLVDKNPYHKLKAQFSGAALNRDGFVIPIGRVISRKNIVFHCGEVIKIDFNNSKIFLDNEKLIFDYLIIALGSKSNFYNIKSLNENTLKLGDHDVIRRIYSPVSKIRSKTSSREVELERKEKLNYIIGENGLTGVDFVDELIWTGGIRVPGLLKEGSFKTGTMGRVIVDEYLRAKSQRKVFALDDNVLIVDPLIKSPFLITAQFALQQGRLIAQNIFNQVYGKEMVKYKPKAWVEFISLGKHLATGWFTLPIPQKITFAGLLARLFKTVIKEKYIRILKNRIEIRPLINLH